MIDSSLGKKLGIKAGNHVLILNAPQEYGDMLDPLPECVQQLSVANGSFDVVHLFVKNQSELSQYGPRAIQAAKPDGTFWISYPKRSTKVVTDLTRDTGWDLVRSAGFEGVAIVAVVGAALSTVGSRPSFPRAPAAWLNPVPPRN